MLSVFPDLIDFQPVLIIAQPVLLAISWTEAYLPPQVLHSLYADVRAGETPGGGAFSLLFCSYSYKFRNDFVKKTVNFPYITEYFSI